MGIRLVVRQETDTVYRKGEVGLSPRGPYRNLRRRARTTERMIERITIEVIGM